MAPKRSAAVHATKPKKVARVDPTLEKCEVVVTALNNLAVDLPPIVRKMLTVMAPKCLPTLAANRLGPQNAVVNMIDDTLKAVDERLSGLVSAKQAPVSDAESEKTVLEGHLLQAEQELERLQQVTMDAKEAVTNGGVELQRAEGRLNDLRVDDGLVRAESACQDLERSYQDVFLALNDRAADEQAQKVLLGLGKKYNFDATLLSAMAAAFGKEPGARGCFDQMIWQQYDSAVMTCIEAAKCQVQEEQVKQRDRGIHIYTAEACRDTAVANVEASKKAYVDATMAEGPQGEVVIHCKTALMNYLPNLQANMNALNKVQVEYDSFRETVIGSFEHLKELAATPKETAAVPAAPVDAVLEAVTVVAAT